MANSIRVLHTVNRREVLRMSAGLPIAAGAWGQAAKAPPPSAYLAFVGTYSRGKSKGIYAYRWKPTAGKYESLGLVAETSNPSFLAVHPNQRFLYAVNEETTGGVSSFSIDNATAQLKFLNRVATRGADPCHLSIERGGKWLFVANYTGGSIAAYPVKDDGTLGEATVFVQHKGSSVNPRQTGPHAHEAVVSPDNRFVLFADLGLDQVLIYPLDASAGGLSTTDITEVKIAPGSGPRHLAFRPDARFVYLVNEISATVTAFRYTPQRAGMEEIQTISTLPDGFTGAKSCAEIAVHPRGGFVYASNRGHDSIAIFRIDAATGKLTAAGHVLTQGKTPRNFAIDPTGNFLLAANQDSDSVVIFHIDGRTGGLTPAGEVLNAPVPVCVVFSPVR